MQFSKKLLTFGTAALCLAAVSSRAVDTEADLKLREALRQKMAEVGPETTAPAAAPAPAKPVKVKAPKKSAPVAPAAPVVAAPVVAAPVVEPAPVAAPAAPAVTAPVVAQPAPVAVDDAQAERLREALRARMQQEAATPAQPQQVITQGSDLEPTVSTTKIVAPTPVQQPVVQAPAKAPVVFEAPASSIPASKEARLAALLQRYKADLISPQEYHEQRAKIIAE
jgi:hypothetical protein